MKAASKIVALSFVLCAFGNGCTANTDDADRFREPIPAKEEIALAVPNGTSTTSQGLRIATTPTPGEVARYYRLTRDLTSGVDGVTALILGGVWAIVSTTPTSIEPKKAVWGPGSGNALEPAIWRFTVREVGAAEYDYTLEGQSKSGGPWLAVLAGHGYGKSRPEHKQGYFDIDNDAYRTLDPMRAKDDGKAKVTYDLRRLPATIDVELRPDPAKGFIDLHVTHEEQGAGSIRVVGLGDLDDSKTTRLENVNLVSRWTSNGSGRADVALANGDLPFAIDATECWSPTFARVYYKDTVNFEPAVGELTSCSLAAP
jgi:hypothetical protein